KEKIDRVLEVMGQQESHLADLLRLRYIEGLPVVEVAAELGVVRRTLGRWRVQAIETYSKLIGMS
ncbi:ECF-type sigma factor, partial [Paenibacillus larvae]